MASLRFVPASPAWLRTITCKTLAVLIAGAMLASAITHAQSTLAAPESTAAAAAHSDLPVAVPQANPSALAEMRHGNILWAFFRLLELAIPLFFLFTGLGTRLRRMCEHISGGRWFWTVTLFACAYLALAALITLPFDFYFGYVQQHAAGKSNQTLPSCVTGEGVQLPSDWSSHRC